MSDDLEEFERQHDPLPALRKTLQKEFDGRVPPETIDQEAKTAVDHFEGVPVRAFLPILAWRRAREVLRGYHGGVRAGGSI